MCCLEAIASECKGQERDQQQSQEISMAGIILPAKTPDQGERRAKRSNEEQKLDAAFLQSLRRPSRPAALKE